MAQYKSLCAMLNSKTLRYKIDHRCEDIGVGSCSLNFYFTTSPHTYGIRPNSYNGEEDAWDVLYPYIIKSVFDCVEQNPDFKLNVLIYGLPYDKVILESHEWHIPIAEVVSRSRYYGIW